MKNDIYSLIIAFLFTAFSLNKKGLLRFAFDIFTGLTISNVVDRFFFDVREWRLNDIIMIVLTLVFAFINYKYYDWRNKSRTTK